MLQLPPPPQNEPLQQQGRMWAACNTTSALSRTLRSQAHACRELQWPSPQGEGTSSAQSLTWA